MEKNWKLLGVASGALLVMLFQWQPPQNTLVEETQRIYELRRLPAPASAEPAAAGNRLREAATLDSSIPAQLLTGR